MRTTFTELSWCIAVNGMDWIREHTPQPEQLKHYRQALIISVAGNLLLTLSKGAAAYLSGSVAIYADAANSVSDLLYSWLMVLGMYLALRPPDLTHPQGHSRFEPLVGIMGAGFMALAGYEASRAALERFFAGGAAVAPDLPTLVLLASATVKVGMFLFIRRLARLLHSPALKVTAQDNLSDVLTSAAAFFGVLGSYFAHPLLDPLAGILVAMWIFRAAYRAARENLSYLTGGGASAALRERIAAAAESVPGVLRVHQTRTEYVGPQLMVDMHINVEGGKTLNEAHDISDAVIARLEALPEVDRAYVHLEPDDWV